ncbi:MAG: hypothetical protein INF84_20055 [Roseomonas sp.]|nr:hypothetical protein [Roseomonas sp.]
MRKLLLALLALLMISTAQAQKAPEGVPGRDALITFRITSGTEVMGEWTISLTNGGRLRRIDMLGIPGGSNYSVMDMQTGRGFQVMGVPGMPQPMVMDLSPEAGRSPMDDIADERKLRFTPVGADQILGIRCEKTMAKDEKGLEAICCRTEEWFGLNLRAEGNDEGRRIRMEAIKIDFGPQDPARFRRPAGISMPMMPGMPGQPPAGRPR